MAVFSCQASPFTNCHIQFTMPEPRLVVRSAVSENSNSTVTTADRLPLRKIPGDCGLPLIGPWRDRQDYFYNQGREDFFKSRMKKYKSTVFRTNLPPGPFISFNTNVVVLLDGKSFPILFDTDKIEKKDLLTGTYAPSADLCGGYRTLSFLDPSETNHAKLKKLMFFLLSHRRDHVIPEFGKCYGELFDSLEDRFVGEEGEKLLKHVLWSNGPENASPSVNDKQCAGKDFVVLAGRLLLVGLFRRYDSFDIEVAASPLP